MLILAHKSFKGMPRICLFKPWIYLFYWLHKTMNSLFSSFLWHEEYKKNYNYSYVRINHIRDYFFTNIDMMLYFGWWPHFLPYYCMNVWRRSTTISTFFQLTKFSLSPLQPYLGCVTQVSCLWVGFQPITLLELSRRIQR